MKETLQTILFIGGFVFLFVLIFRSDDMLGNTRWSARIIISSITGLLAIIIPLINTLIVQAIVPDKRKYSWRVIDESLLYSLHFGTIAIANYLVTIYKLEEAFSLLAFLKTGFITIIVGGIPVAFHLLSKQQKLLAEHTESADEIKKSANPAENRKVEKEIVRIREQAFDLNDVLYFESDKNYINVVLKQGNALRIRSTIKNLENIIANSENFMRCHRAFIVNLYFIEDVSGNAQGLRLSLGKDAIPVSRKYIPQMRNMLQSSVV